MHRIRVKKSQKKLESIFYGRKTSFFRAKKLECKYMKVGTRHLFSYLWPAQRCMLNIALIKIGHCKTYINDFDFIQVSYIFVFAEYLHNETNELFA